jgi:hypothetical protein
MHACDRYRWTVNKLNVAEEESRALSGTLEATTVYIAVLLLSVEQCDYQTLANAHFIWQVLS